MFCSDIPSPYFFIFTDSIPRLIYYSHLTAILASLLLGFFVYFKNKNLLGRILLALTIVFSLWAFFDLIAWTNVDSKLIMFVWSFFGLFYVLINILSFYFVYAFLYKKDLPISYKVFFLVILFPIFLTMPTKYNLGYFDVTMCEAGESAFFTEYYYFLGLVLALWMLVMLLKNYFSKKVAEDKKQVLLLSFGMSIFIFSFLVTGYLASYFGIFEIEQYGLFGMVIFIAFLTYLIVRYEAFNVKTLGAQVLVVVLMVLIFSEFFFVKGFTNQILVTITFFLTGIFGMQLISAVKDEIKQKEDLRGMTEKLGDAYERLHKLDRAKSEFLSIASHQLRTPLTSIKGFTSLLMEGAYGKVPVKIGEVLEKIYVSNERLIKLVEDLLNISRIESGKISFDFKANNIEQLVKEIYDSFVIAAKNKKLALEHRLSAQTIEPFIFDYTKIREVISNLVDNSIKYTKKGGVAITVEDKGEKVWVIVSDTGVGIDPSEQEYIFEKFQRGQGIDKIQTEGVGLGLYVCNKMLKAHNGKIWAESDGVGKGSRFIVELDKNFQPNKG